MRHMVSVGTLEGPVGSAHMCRDVKWNDRGVHDSDIHGPIDDEL